MFFLLTVTSSNPYMITSSSSSSPLSTSPPSSGAAAIRSVVGLIGVVDPESTVASAPRWLIAVAVIIVVVSVGFKEVLVLGMAALSTKNPTSKNRSPTWMRCPQCRKVPGNTNACPRCTCTVASSGRPRSSIELRSNTSANRVKVAPRPSYASSVAGSPVGSSPSPPCGACCSAALP